MNRTLIALLALSITGTAAMAQQVSTASITGSRVRCSDGIAAGHACSDVDILSLVHYTDIANGTTLNDVWGWTDPLNGREYALVGRSNGVALVDISDGLNPVYVGFLPSHNGRQSLWRDMKVYQDHMFVVMDASSDHGMQVFDLRKLRSHVGTDPVRFPIRFEATARYDGVGSAHNLVINEDTGYAYLVGSRHVKYGNCGHGLHFVDIRDPGNPRYAGCFKDTSSGTDTGIGQRGYTHDAQCVIYRGPDLDYVGREICFASNESGLSIADVTDKDRPVGLGFTSYPNVGYAHQGWLTEDHRYFLMNDELDERNTRNDGDEPQTRTVIWDVMDLDDPIWHRDFYYPTESIDHNLYVRGNYMYAANYTTGLRIVELGDFQRLGQVATEAAFFDTHPGYDGLGFNGAWSVYPFFDSGKIIVNSHPDGLYVLEHVGFATTSTASLDAVPESFTLSAAYPNPFNPVTAFTLALPDAAHVDAYAYDLMGRRVAALHNGTLTAGQHTLRFNASDLPSGTYLIRVVADESAATSRATLVK